MAKRLKHCPPAKSAEPSKASTNASVRFPLDTANGLRGRCARRLYHHSKKGAQGVSYVCAVKRKSASPAEICHFLGALIGFMETHPYDFAQGLVEQFLGFPLPSSAPVAEVKSLRLGPRPNSSERMVRMQVDLRWLVREGYHRIFRRQTLHSPRCPSPRKKRLKASMRSRSGDFPTAPAVPVAEK